MLRTGFSATHGGLEKNFSMNQVPNFGLSVNDEHP